MLLIAVLFDATLKNAKTLPAAADEGYWLGCCYFFRDNLRHRAVLWERPWLPDGDVTSGGGCLDLSPGAMSRESDYGISNSGAGATALAGRAGVCGRADRYPSSGGRIPRQ
jgi:hypothetical protein